MFRRDFSFQIRIIHQNSRIVKLLFNFFLLPYYVLLWSKMGLLTFLLLYRAISKSATQQFIVTCRLICYLPCLEFVAMVEWLDHNIMYFQCMKGTMQRTCSSGNMCPCMINATNAVHFVLCLLCVYTLVVGTWKANFVVLLQYDKTVDAVFAVDGAVSIVVDLMQIYREKGAIFTKACTLLGVLAMHPARRMVSLLTTSHMVVAMLVGLHGWVVL